MTTPSFSNNVYNKLKWFVSIVLPAFSSLYFGLSEIYNWPNATQVVGTLALVTTFLGVLLGISSKSYNTSDAPYDGQIVTEVDSSTGKVTYGLEVNDDVDLDTLPDRDRVTFKVVDRN